MSDTSKSIEFHEQVIGLMKKYSEVLSPAQMGYLMISVNVNMLYSTASDIDSASKLIKQAISDGINQHTAEMKQNYKKNKNDLKENDRGINHG